MELLSANTIRLKAQAINKQEAIKQAGKLLVEGGCVNQNYVNGMLAREEQMSTYLGNGVSIPHGMYENLTDIDRSGISVLQLPQGVEWETGQHAYLVIGIAATSDEHVGILSNLAEVIEDEALVQRLSQTDDPTIILEELNRERSSDDDEFDDEFDDDDDF